MFPSKGTVHPYFHRDSYLPIMALDSRGMGIHDQKNLAATCWSLDRFATKTFVGRNAYDYN